MPRQVSGRSRNVRDLVTLRTRQLEPGFRWVRLEADGDDGPDYLQRIPVSVGTRFRIVMHDSDREVRRAVTAFRKLAQAFDAGLDDRELMIGIAETAARYGTLYGDVPANAALATGTLDDWKIELLRYLDLWEIEVALRRPSRERVAASRIVLRTDDASGAERFVFNPRTVDLDGTITIASTTDRWTWADPVTGVGTEMPIFHRMKTGTPRTRLWVTFSTLVTHRMVGRLNLALHPFETTSASVGLAPHGLLALVTLRLWLDVVTEREESTPVTVRTCLHCGGPLPATATARMVFCGDACRQAHRRRLLRS